jgi:hypothetical protein
MHKSLLPLMAVLLLGSIQPQAHADTYEGAVSNCLKAWGEHPFGSKPKYRILSSSVKVFGIGQSTDDTAVTKGPDLVLIDTGVNVMGGSTLQLLNPNGWYCFASNVNVMGSLTIKAHCKAHLAAASNGMTVMGGDPSNKSVTVLGATNVEPVGCSR